MTKWVKKAIKNPGALHKALNIRKGKKEKGYLEGVELAEIVFGGHTERLIEVHEGEKTFARRLTQINADAEKKNSKFFICVNLRDLRAKAFSSFVQRRAQDRRGAFCGLP